jgi:hypothetical protein
MTNLKHHNPNEQLEIVVAVKNDVSLNNLQLVALAVEVNGPIVKQSTLS